MLKKLVVAFAILAVAVAFAGTVPGGGSYKITLLRPSVVNGNSLEAGEYRLNVSADKVTIVRGKNSVDVTAKVESGPQKFEITAIEYSEAGGKATISEIRIGGTKTKVVFQR